MIGKGTPDIATLEEMACDLDKTMSMLTYELTKVHPSKEIIMKIVSDAKTSVIAINGLLAWRKREE